ncbi:hypothetical protein [Bosea sp. PAMC 26642]|uniref:hypothetical protein n=1 Tax=Bosea sp. (strain PAMC 26642) TaxID=1792307 RepID=UPI000770072C|nr:hypothetical protein [Bosea sp. PAMC 26642]AMJ62719.1 hypothetical protein AXW83_22610 [Bosea sp. PAMC 26642]
MNAVLTKASETLRQSSRGILRTLTAVMSLAGPASAISDTRLIVGIGGWQLERFEGEVVVLRTTVSVPAKRGLGLLLLSCAGAQRRINIVLPQVVFSDGNATRSVLIRPVGRPAPGGSPLLATFATEQRRSLTFLETETGKASVVLHLAEMLRKKPAALDMLAHAGPGAIGFRQLAPFILSMTFTDNDSTALDNFTLACRSAVP